MEQALFLNQLHGPLPEGIDRLYFGAEFCPWTFPAIADIEAAMSAARERGLSFTLATPVLLESFLPILRRTLAAVLPRLDGQDEVLISDWGALEPVRDVTADVRVILGRVLSGQKRGQQILDLPLTDSQLEYFRMGSWYAGEAAALLDELAIGRIELDNLLQGIAALPAGRVGSLHLPFAMVTSSRNCPFRKGEGHHRCPACCGEVFTLHSPQSRVPLYQGGNTQFLRNDRLPENLAESGIDRLVRHPLLPR